MAKNIIKEIIIILLLTLAIILVLGVLLYGYVPANKMIPEKVSYTTPEQVKTELEADVNESDDELYVDYHIDSTQLNNYKKIQEYVPGKKNPFASLENENSSSNTTTGTTTGTIQNNVSNSKNITSSNGTQTNSTTEENTGYLPDKGTK